MFPLIVPTLPIMSEPNYRQEMVRFWEDECEECRPMTIKKNGRIIKMSKKKFYKTLKRWKNEKI